jgi:uncharacterized membrane protein
MFSPTSTQLGVVLSVTGNFCISVGFQLQRLAQMYDHRSSIQSMLAWCGCVLMVLGECSNFTAYSMAPVSLVAPLDAVVILSNVMLSRTVFKERLSRSGVMGVMMILLGIVSTAWNAPREREGEKSHEFSHLASLKAVLFLSTACFVAVWIVNPCNSAWGATHQTKRLNVIYYCSLCGLMGMLTVVGAKSMSTALGQAVFSNDVRILNDPEICWFTYLLFSATIGFIFLQIKYLHIVFNTFGPSVVISVYYILFTGLTISAGMFVFDETIFAPNSYTALFVFGLVLTFSGVFAISQDNITLYYSHTTDPDQSRCLNRVIVVKPDE